MVFLGSASWLFFQDFDSVFYVILHDCIRSKLKWIFCVLAKIFFFFNLANIRSNNIWCWSSCLFYSRLWHFFSSWKYCFTLTKCITCMILIDPHRILERNNSVLKVIDLGIKSLLIVTYDVARDRSGSYVPLHSVFFTPSVLLLFICVWDLY